MEFQLFSAVLEDRYPLALAEGVIRRDLLHKGFVEECTDEGPPLQPSVDGAIAFLFGRTARKERSDGNSTSR